MRLLSSTRPARDTVTGMQLVAVAIAFTLTGACTPSSESPATPDAGTPGDVAGLDLSALPTAEEAASTPRPGDVELEYIALVHTPERWIADDDTYARVARDVPAARAAFPELDFDVRQARLAQNAFVMCVDADAAACTRTLTALMAPFDGSVQPYAVPPNLGNEVGGLLSWPGIFQPNKTASVLAGVTALSESHVGPDDFEEGPTIDLFSVDADGDSARYRFLNWSEDCPEGCQRLQASLVEVVGGTPTIVDTYANVPDAVCPDWLVGCPPAFLP